jgi:tRNA-specific 2-thiouridylase
MTSESRKAIALLSGGLDSQLAIAVVRAQEIEVEALHFCTGFSAAERRRRLGRASGASEDAMRQLARDLGVEVRLIDVSEEYMDIVLHPRYGYGANVNPCLDCHLFMLRKSRQLMEQLGADFVITGEVLGQRPMSQYRRALRLLEKESGLEELLLRPLSAKLLPPTVPEREGWVDRDRLYAIEGRSRKPQMRLAQELGLVAFPQPAGGCLLTDETFARRFRDLVAHRDVSELGTEDMTLLGIGRHFRLSERAKCIVGREEAENDYLDRVQATRGRMVARDHMGPVTLVEGDPTDVENQIIARITARYSDGKHECSVAVLHTSRGLEEILRVEPMSLKQAHEFMI